MNTKIVLFLAISLGGGLLSLVLGLGTGALIGGAGMAADSKGGEWSMPTISPRTSESVNRVVERFEGGYTWGLAEIRAAEAAAAQPAAEEIAAAAAAAERARQAEAAKPKEPTWRFIGVTNEASKGEVVALVSLGNEIARYRVGDKVVDKIELVGIEATSITVLQDGVETEYALFHRPVPIK